jgi:hypothetical protein
MNLRPWENRWLEISPQWNPYVVEKKDHAKASFITYN